MENQYMKDTEEGLLKTYNRFPVVFDHGEGVYLYDTDGKKYLDFTAGIAVNSLGYGNPEFTEAIKAQVDQLIHISNLYYNTTCGAAALALRRISRMDKVFFTNSGAEAVEGALKAARKYAYEKKSGRYEFIAMEDAFHGRTMGSVSVTGHKEYREPFEPMIGGVHFAKYNDLESVKALVNEKTCAIILETIQGEGGITPAEPEFLKGIRKICDDKDILLILDEIQCGMGRSGSYFAWQQMDVKPDIMTMAKAIGNGVPVGAFAMTDRVAKYSLKPGDHGTTYGGNPLACAAVKTVIDLFEKNDLVGHVGEIAPYLTQKLGEIVKECECAVEVRGKGLIQGLKITKPVGEVTANALKEGLVVISAGKDVLRMIPPLVIEREHVDEMAEKLKRVL
ncbi:MAG: aspartate aminotransferase family protein [Coprococcus sp.]|nr:aspartate aminotransferase family protein [Coprococcus sp.]